MLKNKNKIFYLFKYFVLFVADDLFNCLIDWLTIKFSDVRLYEGFRVEISKVQDVQGLFFKIFVYTYFI